MAHFLSLKGLGNQPQPSPMTIKRVQREINDLKREDMGGMRLAPAESSILVWTGALPGPEGSLYEGGIFEFDLTLPIDYPFSAPKIVFKTRIYHMNIAQSGHICLDILKGMWSPALSLFKVMLSLSSLLTDPNPNDPLVPTIANEYKSNREKHDSTARSWTQLYATKKSPNGTVLIPDTPTSNAERPARHTTSSRRPAAQVAPQHGAGASSSASVIEISDEEDLDPGNEPTGSNSASAGSKRKRRTRDDGPSLSGSGSLASTRATKRAAPNSTRLTRSRTNNPGNGTTATETIVIDDD